MSFAVVRMAKMKSHDLKGIQFHNQRERESKTNPDIDKERSHQNYDLVNERPIDYNKRVKEIIESQKTGTRKTRKDAVLVNELLVTSDTTFFEKLSPVDEKRFFEESFKFFYERYGKQNIAYATVHMDEKTPHMHIGVVPMRDGKLQGKNVFNRAELLAIQEDFPKHMRSLGFELERGEKGSDREHIETNKFKKQTLEKEIELLEKSVSAKKDELNHLSELVPVELKIKAKKEMETVIEDKIVHFGKPKTIEKETGNFVITPEEYKKIHEIVNAAATIKKDYDRLRASDPIQAMEKSERDYEKLRLNYNELVKKHNKILEGYKVLFNENNDLKAHISDLRAEVAQIYKTTKEFIKERTKGVRAFKDVFKSLVDKVKEKVPGGEFEKVHKREINRERDREFER